MKHYLEQMPLYVAGQLDPAAITELEQHLEGCPDCQAELDFWRTLSGEILAANTPVAAPVHLAERALQRVRAGAAMPGNGSVSPGARMRVAVLRAFSLLRAQAYLIKHEMWPASAVIMALGVIVALISNHAEAMTFIAPVVAAASMATLYSREHDPAYELALATPTSAWSILLARLSVVSSYNLLLSLLSSLAMLWIIPPDLLGLIILGWLAPMAFLSALALLLSLWMGANNAIVISYGLWIAQYLQVSKILENWGFSTHWDGFYSIYRNFWQSPGLLLILSLVLLGVALLSTRFTERGLLQISV